MWWRIFLLLMVVGISTTIASISLKRRTVPGAVSLIVFAFAQIIWVIPSALFWTGVLQGGLLLRSVTYLAVAIVPTALYTFALEYTHPKWVFNWRSVAILAVEPVMSQFLIWTYPAHEPFVENDVEIAGTILTAGTWSSINEIYADILLFAAFVLLLQTFTGKPLLHRLRSGVILGGTLFPILINILGFANLGPIRGLDLTMIAFIVTGLVYAYGLIHHRWLGIPPIARDLVVERMSEGWVVLNAQDCIVDLNSAAEEVIGLPRDRVFGQSAENILSDWPNVMKRIGDARELDIKGSVNMRDGRRYLNLRISPLTEGNGHHFGRLIIWRDITERRKAEEARQRARDEMFSLLHAISGAASRAQSMDDFLSASIYQLIYSFQSQSSVIFLLDESSDESEGRRLLLAAHQGLPAQSVDGMSSIPEESDMFAWVMEHREPLLIPDISADPRIPIAMQQIGQGSFLLVPMATEGQMVGMIGLVRKGGLVYATDEIARLTAVAEEVATFIHSDRRRQLATALAERQRLVRDLHDSVTQKLYGLVTLTEAAQAGLEAGSADMPAQVLSRIGENARQALKEMRLFLHELQPVDLEREGLVAILHQRLAAVEGRSDVKARLLADENISLPLDKEVALYFIAQEALNNVLRHARAKSVTVRLKQKKENVILEVVDDGCGFDSQKGSLGGMGLRNMKERAIQMGGKLKLASVLGKGTKLSVTVRRDRR
jgi:PAS domain S-box-containing protein